MIPELEQLVKLQALDLEIRALDRRLAQIPKEVAALEMEIATERANLKSAQGALAQCLKDRRTRESDLELIEQKVSKFKDQLMQIKKNDEFRAMQKQIENFQLEGRAKEDEILESMEVAEKLQIEVKSREKELKEGEERIRVDGKALEAEATKLRAERSHRAAARAELVAGDGVTSELLTEYERVAKLRGGIAVAEAKDEFCVVCHVRLRPQVYNEIRQERGILKCDSCGRFLYYIGPPPGPPPEPAEAAAPAAAEQDAESSS